MLCLTECLLILGILHFSFYVWPRFHWDYEQHTNPDAKVNPTRGNGTMMSSSQKAGVFTPV